ncbi:hypothetical protein [Filimonas effusa]|uniref:DUF4352 domain-containing protein n=1 Tax=Filimonas effusa TaxID=2508721 RepID=A0A4Q1D991_9BACT|nr:hypothetical protein [Filimonas effusa]RXK85265.1 hypothetical protein ESB13_00090 [Filimonas effusa]
MKKIDRNILFILPACIALIGSACHSPAAVAKKEIHMAEIAQGQGSSIYVDRVPNRSVLKEQSADSSFDFCCYRVGWIDSATYTKDQEAKWTQYFNYEMQYDWTVVCEGDSLSPVLFQPIPGRNKQTSEGVLVFEVPKNQLPDTLIFKNSYGSDKVNQLIVLNPHK